MKPLNNLIRSDPPNGSQAGELQDLSPLIDAIGQPTFPAHLLSVLDELVGADHCTLYRLRDREIEKMVSLGREGIVDAQDAGLTAYELSRYLSQTSSDGIRISFERISDLRSANNARPSHKAQRIVVCGRRPDAAYAICILRPCDGLPVAEKISGQLRSTFSLLLSAAAKHADANATRPSLSQAFSSLPEMQQFIFGSSTLSLRESEVCARMLFGQSPCDIATELEIGKESVITYRKRAFQRLDINSQRELLIWYLELWSTNNSASARMGWVARPRDTGTRTPHARTHLPGSELRSN